MNRIQRQRISLLVLSMLILVMVLPTTSEVLAHGEQNLEPFVRMRGVTFLNVHYSRDSLAVNDTMTVSGKVWLMESWPRMLTIPELAYVNILVPGPKIAVKERWINGTFIQNAFRMEKGRLYTFKIVLKARVPGRYHVHPMFNLEGTGGLVGPGRYITVRDSKKDKSHTITISSTGESVDIEYFGWNYVIGWHSFFILAAIGWLAYWAYNPLLIRYVIQEESSNPDELITQTDLQFSWIIAAILVVVTGGGLLYTIQTAGPTIPHQVKKTYELPEVHRPAGVKTQVKKMEYRPTKREMMIRLTVKNPNLHDVLLRKFVTSYLSFVSVESLRAYPVNNKSIPRMRVKPSAVIEAESTKELTLLLQDSVWETDQFINYKQPQITAAGVVVFTHVGPEVNDKKRPTIMFTNNQSGKGIRWDRVVSINELYKGLDVNFARTL